MQRHNMYCATCCGDAYTSMVGGSAPHSPSDSVTRHCPTRARTQPRKRKYIKHKGLACAGASANAAHPEVATSAATALATPDPHKIKYKWRKRKRPIRRTTTKKWGGKWAGAKHGPWPDAYGVRPPARMYGSGPWPGHAKRKRGKRSCNRIRAAGR